MEESQAPGPSTLKQVTIEPESDGSAGVLRMPLRSKRSRSRPSGYDALTIDLNALEAKLS